MSNLLSSGALQPVFFVYQTLGRKEDSAALDAARQRKGLGWKRWSTKWLYTNLGLYHDYSLRRGTA
jgi:RNA-directed DNA polymerase